jgi:hypothetical protein
MIIRQLASVLAALSLLTAPVTAYAEASCTRTTGTLYEEYECGGLIARPWVRYLCDDGVHMYWSSPSWTKKPKCEVRHYAE